MPAMSPTMTEGTIAAWKVKEGQQFHAGDVLLEIETDKAQMDVEAQDDGVMAKVLVRDGTQKVLVGQVIAITAEDGDDISSLDLEVNEEKMGPVSRVSLKSMEGGPSKPKSDSTMDQANISTDQVRKDIHLPAVLRLLYDHQIEDPRVITPTGPHGRLLKGDVLAYVGAIDKEIPMNLKRIVEKKQTLDLSNIVLQRPADSQGTPTSTVTPTPPAKPRLAMVETIVHLRPSIGLQAKAPGNLGRDVALERLLDDARVQALKEIPSFGLRRLSQLDLVFSDLIGETLGEEVISTRAFEPEVWSPPIEDQDPQGPSNVRSNDMVGSVRIPAIVGEAFLHYEPLVDKSSTVHADDALDSLLNETYGRRHLVTTESNSEIKIRLEYDDVVISPESAEAYLEHLKRHMESPGRRI